MKIIQIDGIRGLITAAFMGVCLFAGFVMFPGLVAMHYWNKYLVNLYMFPSLNLFQGVLLWGIIAVSYFILSKKGLAVSFKNTPELSDEELDMIMKRAKLNSHMKMMSKVMSNSDKFEAAKKKVMEKDNEVKDSFVSSPFGINKKDSVENIEEDKVSNIK